jgi:hypothetical protein
VAAVGGEALERLDAVELRVVDRAALQPRSGCDRSAPVLAGQEPAREREVRDVRDAELAAEREHIGVVPTLEQRVVVVQRRDARLHLA